MATIISRDDLKFGEEYLISDPHSDKWGKIGVLEAIRDGICTIHFEDTDEWQDFSCIQLETLNPY